MRFPDRRRRLRVALFAEPWTIELDADLREVLDVQADQALLIGAAHNELGALGVAEVDGKLIRIPVALLPDHDGVVRHAVRQAAAFLYKGPKLTPNLAPVGVLSTEVV